MLGKVGKSHENSGNVLKINNGQNLCLKSMGVHCSLQWILLAILHDYILMENIFSVDRVEILQSC